MLKCRDSKIRNTSVESVAEHLHEQIATIIDNLDRQIVNTPGKVYKKTINFTNTNSLYTQAKNIYIQNNS